MSLSTTISKNKSWVLVGYLSSQLAALLAWRRESVAERRQRAAREKSRRQAPRAALSGARRRVGGALRPPGGALAALWRRVAAENP